jgi:hypothetical protein
VSKKEKMRKTASRGISKKSNFAQAASKSGCVRGGMGSGGLSCGRGGWSVEEWVDEEGEKAREGLMTSSVDNVWRNCKLSRLLCREVGKNLGQESGTIYNLSQLHSYYLRDIEK